MAQSALYDLYTGDCMDVLPRFDAGSVHLVVTDPPYFLDGFDDRWTKGKGGPRGTGAVGGLPPGMKFSVNQGPNLQSFLRPIADELYRVLKPGGFLLMFSAGRLYHRVATAVEDAGFEIRDQYAWRYHGKAQFKAFKQDHFVRQRTDISDSEKDKIIATLDGRRTPQLRQQHEPIVCAQKPREGTFVNNWLTHRTGLIDAGATLDGKSPSTIMTVEKQSKPQEIDHMTPKPVQLCAHLIRLFSEKGQTVLDPFVGSGSTCVAAQSEGRRSIGIDVNPDYIKLTQKRLRGS